MAPPPDHRHPPLTTSGSACGMNLNAGVLDFVINQSVRFWTTMEMVTSSIDPLSVEVDLNRLIYVYNNAVNDNTAGLLFCCGR